MRELLTFNHCMCLYYFFFYVSQLKQWVPECNSLPFKHPHLMGVSGDEWRFTEKLLLRNGPEVSSREVLG